MQLSRHLAATAPAYAPAIPFVPRNLGERCHAE